MTVPYVWLSKTKRIQTTIAKILDYDFNTVVKHIFAQLLTFIKVNSCLLVFTIHKWILFTNARAGLVIIMKEYS